MRIPSNVLSSLASKSKDINYKYRNLYRNLYNPEFYLIAYAKIAPKVGNMTEGTDSKTIDGMSLKRIERIIESLKDESYQPKPSKRVQIPKKNSDAKRPLGIPSVDDKLLQEVVRMLLEAMYDESFSNKSHGFRPKLSCHTALKQVSRTFAGTRWFVEGDIKGFFDNINHKTLINILRKRISDERFLRLISKFLKAGYIENWTFRNTYSGTPQGGIISPILSNIYLNELDKYIEEYSRSFNKGKARKQNLENKRLNGRANMAIRRMNDKEKLGKLSDEEKQRTISKAKELKSEALKLPAMDEMDESFRRMSYVRYADDFLIGVIGTKKESMRIKEDLTKYLCEKLDLELSDEKTLITHSKKGAKFLGYEILIGRNPAIKVINGIKRRTTGYTVYLKLPKEKWMGKLIELDALIISKSGEWKSIHRKYLERLDLLEIVSTYNSEILGLYNYYKLANNVSVLNQFHYIMEYSMYKTIATKQKISVREVINKYTKNGEFRIKYENRKGLTVYRNFYKGSFKRMVPNKTDENVDVLPNMLIYAGRNSLIKRLTANKCEWCHEENVDIEMHHVKKLKDLKGKKMWEKLMISRQRKTIAMCVVCHDKLHAGKLN